MHYIYIVSNILVIRAMNSLDFIRIESLKIYQLHKNVGQVICTNENDESTYKIIILVHTRKKK